MTLRIAPVSSSANRELLELVDGTNVGTDLFRIDRRPDYFALGRQLTGGGSPMVLGAFDGDALVGTVSAARQRRIVDGREEDVHYLHDLRVAPGARRRGVAARLVRTLDDMCPPSEPVCATVLDGNPHAPEALVRAAEGRGLARIGQTAHVGLPLFGDAGEAIDGRDELELVALTHSELTDHRARLAGPDDRVAGEPWRSLDGSGFGLARGGDIVWVAHLATESSRRFVPLGGEALSLSYIAYPSDRAIRWACAFRDALVRRAIPATTATYLFAGAPATEADVSLPCGALRFTSTTWAFVRGPAWSSADIHELTRM